MIAGRFEEMTSQEAAELIPDGGFIGFSGFTAAGSAKAVPEALAERAEAMHAAGDPMRIRVIAGASTNDLVDERLARAEAISWRAPYQSARTLRRQINRQDTKFADLHLSHLGQMLSFGFLGELDVAVVEATEITADGRVYLATSSGVTPHLLHHARRVIIELNAAHTPRLSEMHDVAMLPKPPRRGPINLHHPMDRIGTPYATVDPSKVAGVVRTNAMDGVAAARAPDDVSEAIASHVVEFLVAEMKAGRIPPEFLPLQAGVGNVANAVLGRLGADDRIPPFYMFTEVLQDSQVELLGSGKLLGASTSALTLHDDLMTHVQSEMDYFSPRIVIRPTEISNNPELVRRLGLISINTVLEFDIYGCANSTHVCGSQLMNGIGGSGDFIRNAYLSILVAPSAVKGGNVSTVVPMSSHVDHNEHSVQVLVTEQGLADLRGLGPVERARAIIDRCAHPDYRDELTDYLESAPPGHAPHNLERCFAMHRRLLETGSMKS